jgi:hypothetical protein
MQGFTAGLDENPASPAGFFYAWSFHCFGGRFISSMGMAPGRSWLASDDR